MWLEAPESEVGGSYRNEHAGTHRDDLRKGKGFEPRLGKDRGGQKAKGIPRESIRAIKRQDVVTMSSIPRVNYSSGSLVASSTSDVHTDEMNTHLRNDAAMMSNKKTMKTIEWQDILTPLVIGVVCTIGVLLLVLLWP